MRQSLVGFALVFSNVYYCFQWKRVGSPSLSFSVHCGRIHYSLGECHTRYRNLRSVQWRFWVETASTKLLAGEWARWKLDNECVNLIANRPLCLSSRYRATKSTRWVRCCLYRTNWDLLGCSLLIQRLHIITSNCIWISLHSSKRK